MKAKGKAPKVLISTGNSGSRPLTFPKGDASQEARHMASNGRHSGKTKTLLGVEIVSFCVG